MSVEPPPAVTEVGTNAAVAPAGRPVAESATLCAEPLVRAVLMADVPLWPWVTVTAVGDALIEKSFDTGALTVSDTDVVCVAFVPVPVIVIVEVPRAAVALALNVSVELPPLVTGVGLNEAVTPVGRLLVVSETL